jgi:hypothetical protein
MDAVYILSTIVLYAVTHALVRAIARMREQP